LFLYSYIYFYTSKSTMKLKNNFQGKRSVRQKIYPVNFNVTQCNVQILMNQTITLHQEVTYIIFIDLQVFINLHFWQFYCQMDQKGSRSEHVTFRGRRHSSPLMTFGFSNDFFKIKSLGHIRCFFKNNGEFLVDFT